MPTELIHLMLSSKLDPRTAMTSISGGCALPTIFPRSAKKVCAKPELGRTNTRRERSSFADPA